VSGKTKTTTGPSKAALPYINSATAAAQSGYDQSSALASKATGILSDNIGNVLGQTLNNPNLAAAGNYNQQVLNGDFLDSNPFFDEMVSNSNSNVANKVNGSIGTRGLTGGSAQTQLLASELAKNETGLRSNQYNTERGYQQAAVGNAANLSSAGNQSIATLLAYLTGTAELPQAAANNYASSIGSLWGNSTTSTQKQGVGSLLGGVVGSGLAGWASGGFKGV
jgi:hypothetical protein